MRCILLGFETTGRWLDYNGWRLVGHPSSIFTAFLVFIERFVAAHLLKPLLIFATSFVVRAEIVSAVLDQLLADFLTLRTTRSLESHDYKQ